MRVSDLFGTGPKPSRRELTDRFERLAKSRGVDNWVSRFEPGSVMSGAVKLHLEVIESANLRAPTVVFVPGTNAYGLLYGQFLCALADEGFNVVAVDPRGHGLSDGARGSYELPELMRDLDAAVHHAKSRFKGDVFVAGSSQGGITALYYVAAYGGVQGAICHNLADLEDDTSVQFTRSPNLARRARPVVEWLAARFPEFPVPMEAYLNLRAEPVRGLGTAHDVLWGDPMVAPFVRLRALASLSSYPLARPLEELTTPILVLQAGDDTIFRTEHVRVLFDRLGGAKEMRVYPGLHHYMIVDSVPAFAPDVVRWIRSHARRVGRS